MKLQSMLREMNRSLGLFIHNTNASLYWVEKHLRTVLFLIVGVFFGYMAGDYIFPDANAEILPQSAFGAAYDSHQGSAPQRLAGVFAGVDATGDLYAVESAAMGSDEMLFPHGTQIVVSCTSQAMVCWTMQDADDMTSMTVATMVIVDTNGTLAGNGRGACARIEAGTYRSLVLDLQIFSNTSAVGRRQRSCTLDIGAPCVQTADCETGGDTCNAGSTFNAILFAHLAGDAGASSCSWVDESWTRRN